MSYQKNVNFSAKVIFHKIYLLFFGRISKPFRVHRSAYALEGCDNYLMSDCPKACFWICFRQ